MPSRWMVRSARGAVAGWYATEQAARSRDGHGRLVPDPDGRSMRRYDLPEGWTAERVELPELSTELVMAVAYLASQADGGCPHCVGRQQAELETMWPDVDWQSAIQSASPRYNRPERDDD